jgi:hypothetical protein
MAGSLFAAPFSTEPARAAGALPLCGDIATCLSMAEHLARPVQAEPCRGAVVTNCVQPAVDEVVKRMIALTSATPVDPVERALSDTLTSSFFDTAYGLAADAVQTLSACANGDDPTCNSVKGSAVAIVTAVIDEAQGCETNAPGICQDLTALVDSVATSTLAEVEQCATGSAPTCQAVIQLAEAVASLATGFVSQCLTGSQSTCNSVIQLAEQTAALALGTAESCTATSNNTCNQVIDAVTANLTLLQGAAYACINSDNATCYTVNSAVEGSVYDAGMVPVGCVYDQSTTCGSVVAAADDTAANTQHALLSTLVCPNLVNLCQTISSQPPVEVSTPGLYDPADGGSPTDITLWDLVDPPAMPVSVDQTAVQLSGAALGLTERTGDQCTPAWYYDIDKAYGYKKIFRHGKHYWSQNNDSDGTGHISEQDTEENTLGVTISASAEVEAGVIISHVKTTFGISGSATWSYQNSHSQEHEVRPHELGHFGAGDVGWKTRGHYYHVNGSCTSDIDKGWVISWEPYDNVDGYWHEPAATTE